MIKEAELRDLIHLEPVIEAWLKENNSQDFGIIVDVNEGIRTMMKLIELPYATLLTDEEYSGFMGLILIKSPVGTQNFCNERFWYIHPEKRGKRALDYIRTANEWAKKKGCSHLMLSASYVASDLADKVMCLYERVGFKKFEGLFLREVI